MSSTLRPRVVIVDDEADFRTTLTDILSTRGYDCISAATIQEGTRLISELQPDLCLLDLRLPDGSGLDLLTRMAELSPATETVVLTGFASLPTAVKALNLGAFGYLEKPYNADRLFLTLERALEHRRLVQAIRRSEAAYEQLLTATGAIVFSLDPRTWRVADTNPAFARMLGLDPSDLRLDQLVPESELATVKQALTELSRARPGQSASLTLDVPLLGQDGAAHWFSVNAFCVPRSSAEPRSAAGERVRSEEVNLLLVGSDASASRRAVSQLERTKEFIEGVFAALPCGVVIVDSDYRIIDCNPTYTQPLGLTRAAVKGKYCYQVFSNHQSPCAMFGELCPITAARTTGAIGRVYREHRLPDGRQRNLECSASPLHDEHDSIIGFVVVINDLTDLREAEERLQEAKIRLESLNRDLRRSHEELQEKSASLERANRELIRLSNAKSDFVATVSHELRTPLTAISEGIALVEDGSLGDITQNQRRFLALARQNTRRLSDLINDLLDLSKIEAGRLDLHPRRLDLAAIVREVVGAFAPLARDKNLSLSCSFGKPGQDATTSPFEVLADEASVHRIFNNLINNALKFTPAQGTVQVLVAQDEAAGQVVTTVQDSGIGIPASEQHRIFGRFEQVAPAATGRPRGTGLGLALTKHLVEVNQGRIWFESEEDKGTRFHFTLPVYAEAAEFDWHWRQFTQGQEADAANGRRAIYLFRTEAKDRELASELLLQVNQIVEHHLPRSSMVFPLPKRQSLLALTPVRLSDDAFSILLDSLRGASFFAGDREAEVHLSCATLDLARILAETGSRALDIEEFERLANPLLKEIR